MSSTAERLTTSRGRPESLGDARASLSRRGLYRSHNDRVLGGVCTGLGQRVGLKPWTARLLFLLVLMLLPGSQLLVYPLLWWLLPLEPVAIGGAVRGAPRHPGSA